MISGTAHTKGTADVHKPVHISPENMVEMRYLAKSGARM